MNRENIRFKINKVIHPSHKHYQPNVTHRGFAQLLRAIPCNELGDKPIGLHFQNEDIYVHLDLLDQLNARLHDDCSDARRISNHTIHRAFVYLDVSDFSKYPPGHQAIIINSIVKLANTIRYWYGSIAADCKKSLETQICIGDGYIYVFKDASDAVVFASCLAYYIERIIAQKINSMIPVEFHFRIGAHYGPVFCFWDPGRNDWNFIGDGINGGQRVLTAAGKDKDDVIYISSELRKSIYSLNEKHSPFLSTMRRCMSNRGRSLDKHGGNWRLYEVNHEDLVAPYLAEYSIW